MPEYSAYSQRCLLKRDELRGKVADLNRKVNDLDKQIAAGEKEKEKFGESLTKEASAWVQNQFDLASHRLSQQSEMRRIFQERIAKTQAELHAITPTPEKQKARTERQEELARLSCERLEKDRRANSLVKDLRALLKARMELTARMAECISDLDMTLGKDGLDAARFDDLLASLPAELANTSENWHARFLGRQQGLQFCIVRSDQIVVSETLASHGVYYFCDGIYLSDEQAIEFFREDGSALPSVMTLSDFALAKAKAALRGISVQEVVFWADVERDAAARNQAKSQMGKIGSSRQNIDVRRDKGFVSDLRIRAKAKGRIMGGGRVYEKGDSIDLVGKQEAWRLVDSGLVGPPWMSQADGAA